MKKIKKEKEEKIPQRVILTRGLLFETFLVIIGMFIEAHFAGEYVIGMTLLSSSLVAYLFSLFVEKIVYLDIASVSMPLFIFFLTFIDPMVAQKVYLPLPFEVMFGIIGSIGAYLIIRQAWSNELKLKSQKINK